MNRPLARYYGQVVWLIASALFVAALMSATAPDDPSRPFVTRVGR